MLEFEEAYERYRPLLLSMLGRLGRSGYVVPPTDGLELVHDFFVEAWLGLQERYNPSQGQFSTYMLGAFVRFARPRIVRSMRWRRTLQPLDEIARRLDTDALLWTSAEDTHDLAVLRKALQRLPSRDRRILEQRVGSGLSERETARRFGMSRYRLRKASIEALGRLAVAIDEPGVVGKQEWPLARALWGEGKTLSDAAQAVGLTVTQARLAYQRTLHALASGLTSGSHVTARIGGVTMNYTFCSAWKALLQNQQDQNALNWVRGRLSDFLDHLDECDECAAVCEHIQDPMLLYETLGMELGELLPEDEQSLQAMLQAKKDDEIAVERAVNDALLPSLPEALANLEAWGPDFTPRTVFQAAEAVAMLLHRFVRLTRPDTKVLDMSEDGSVEADGETLIPAQTVVREVGRFAEVSEDTAIRLTAWLVRAARSQPRLFLGLEASPQRDKRVQLTLTERRDSEDLFEYWQPTRVVSLASYSTEDDVDEEIA